MRLLLACPRHSQGRLGLEKVVWLSAPVALSAVGTAVQDGNDVKAIALRPEGWR